LKTFTGATRLTKQGAYDRQFAWAERYGAFPVSESTAERVLICNRVDFEERYLI